MWRSLYTNFYGYVNRQGDYVIAPKFQKASEFRNGLAVIKIDGKRGIIDKTGAYVVEPRFYDNYTRGIERIDIQDRIFRVFKNGKYGFIDRCGNYIVEPKFPNSRLCGMDADECMIEIIGDNDRYGFIDMYGNMVAWPQFDNVEHFMEGCARVEVDGKYGFIDRKGKYMVRPMYDNAQNYFADGYAWIESDERYGFMDSTGRPVTGLVFDDAKNFEHGMAPVSINGRWGVINTDGDPIISPEYDQIDVLSNCPGFVRVKKMVNSAS